VFYLLLFYSVWLLPNREDSKYLSNFIDELSKTYGGPKFPPHLTAFGDIQAKPEIIEKIVKESIMGINQFKVKKKALEFSDYVFKAAYLSLENNFHLQTINKKLDHGLSDNGKYKFEPHISLLYKIIDDSKREKIKNEIRIKNELTIDRISVVQITEKVEDWKTILGPINMGTISD